MRLEVNTKGLDDLLGRLQKALGDLSGFFKSAGQVIVSSVNRNFIEGGRPTPWKPLNPATVLQRMQGTKGYRQIKRGPNKGRITKATAENIGAAGFRILRESDVLMASIGAKSGNGVYRLTPHSLEIGTSVPYAAVHQFGTKYIPARPFMVVQEEDVDDIVKIAIDMIAKAAK